jgi:ABC-type sugar transport system ATPase subunit
MNVSVRTPDYVLRISNVAKTYPGVRALDDVTLDIAASQVHGIVGENGAGKSTLMKTVSGAIRHDSGSIEAFGTMLVGGDPHRAADAGVAMVYQELTVVPDMSALGNVLLGRLPSRAGIISRSRARTEFERTAATIGFSVDPDCRAGDLSTAEQQLLEIMRALSSQRKLMILDEPTASLGPEDIRRLHEVIRNLRSRGGTFVYVSHDLGAVDDDSGNSPLSITEIPQVSAAAGCS